MNIVLGATGHVGSAVAQALLDQKEHVVVISRNKDKASRWQQRGAEVALVDVADTPRLREILSKGRRVFLLNPPADPSTDTAAEEHKSVASILDALRGAPLERIVALSTYGAQPGRGIGDLGVLYELEDGLSQMPIPSTIIRAAYYMSNWQMSLASARDEGKVYSFFPENFKLPMVDPADVGKVAAKLLLDNNERKGIQYVEGPEHYSPADVASAFSNARGKRVEAVTIPREQWVPTMRSVGFSAAAAESMAAMTALTLKGLEVPQRPIKGETTLEKYIASMVAGN